MNHVHAKNHPIVSCIVPCFNELPHILNESLGSLLNQTFKNFECIVVDESTNFESASACKNFCQLDGRFTYIRPSKKLGLAGSLNLGIEQAKGLFLARFDSDDICRHDRFALQVDYLNANPEIGVVGSSIDIIGENGSLIRHRSYPVDHSEIERNFIFSSAIAHPTAMLRKSVLIHSGRAYDPSFQLAEDLDLWLRLLAIGVKFGNLPQALVKYRQQHTGRHKNHWKFNIKARLKNISRPYFARKIIGIFGIAFWAILPAETQKFFFKLIHLK